MKKPMFLSSQVFQIFDSCRKSFTNCSAVDFDQTVGIVLNHEFRPQTALNGERVTSDLEVLHAYTNIRSRCSELFLRGSENMQQIYRKTAMSKYDFNKVAKRLY